MRITFHLLQSYENWVNSSYPSFILCNQYEDIQTYLNEASIKDPMFFEEDRKLSLMFQLNSFSKCVDLMVGLYKGLPPILMAKDPVMLVVGVESYLAIHMPCFGIICPGRQLPNVSKRLWWKYKNRKYSLFIAVLLVARPPHALFIWRLGIRLV